MNWTIILLEAVILTIAFTAADAPDAEGAWGSCEIYQEGYGASAVPGQTSVTANACSIEKKCGGDDPRGNVYIEMVTEPLWGSKYAMFSTVKEVDELYSEPFPLPLSLESPHQ